MRRHLLTFGFVLGMVLTARGTDVPRRVHLEEQFRQRLAASTLAEQRQLLHDWSVNMVLPDLAHAASQVEEKFAGVQGMGRVVLKMNGAGLIDVSAMAYRNPDYWIGVMEMVPGNHLIAAMPAFMHLANGEWDQAQKLFGFLGLFASNDNPPAAFVAAAIGHLEVCDSALSKEISRGIALHDEGKFAEAIAVYEGILAAGVRSPWARYELFFSTASRGGKRNLLQSMEGAGPGSWEAAAAEIYDMDRLYPTQFGGRRGKDMAALIDRLALKMLSAKANVPAGPKVATYADLALKLEAYPVAAHLYWFSLAVKDTGLSTEERIMRFLYCLEKLGVTEVKKNFKDNFPKKFKKLDKELAKHRAS